jgi:alpha-galactosidase
MDRHKITMVGAGSGFVINVARELAVSETLQNSTFVLMDTDPARLDRARGEVDRILKEAKSGVRTEATTDLARAVDGSRHVIASCEINRNPNWIKDIEIPRRHGVSQLTGENGGPGGIIHAMRNISMFMPILAEVELRAPQAWLMNFTNPMSFLCTYFKNYSALRAMGFCHQVHGTFGVIAEMLGMEPGALEVITGGINHFNWLFDVRKRQTGQSCMKEFLEKVRASKYWRANHENIPPQKFTLEILETFDAYCVGYDDHIVEYLPFFYEEHEWAQQGFVSRVAGLRRAVEEGDMGKSLEAMTLLSESRRQVTPFPKDNNHPYYVEKLCAVIEAIETNRPAYLDAINIVNHGSISNLPADAVVDIPAVVVGGEVRGIHLGELPIGPMELCRRQITIHEMIARATHEGNEKLVVQALCLDPYVRSITQARAIWRDYREEFLDCLPTFQ